MQKWLSSYLFLLVTSLVFPYQSFCEEIRIGGIYSLSGTGSIGGSGELNAAQIAIDEINNTGGINGKRIAFFAEDNRSIPKESIAAYKKLTNINKIRFLLGPNWAEFTEPVAHLANQDRILMLSTSGYSPGITKDRPYLFITYPGHMDQVAPLAQYIDKNYVQQKKSSSVYILNSTNTYFNSIKNALVEQLPRQSFQHFHEFNPGTTDYRSLITRMNKDNIPAVVAFLQEGSDISAFLKQARELKYSGEILTFDISYDDAIMQNLGNAEGVIFFKYLTPNTTKFNLKYESRFKIAPIASSAFTYDSVLILKAGIEQCGTDPSILINCLKKLDFTGITGKITFDNQQVREGSGKVTSLFTVRNGKIIPL